MPPKKKARSAGAAVPKSYQAIARQRVVIENMRPALEGGYPIKRVPGETVTVQADAYADGHDVVRCALRVKRPGARKWEELEMHSPQEDVWEASFQVDKTGDYLYSVCGWVDLLASWHHGLERKVAAGQDVRVELQDGAEAFRQAAEHQRGKLKKRLLALAELLEDPERVAEAVHVALGEGTKALMAECPHAVDRTESARLPLRGERRKAGFSSWYEFFPRSASGSTERHGTFDDARKKVLPLIARMGFDVIYLPPIHPLGVQFRKGPNNSTASKPGDPGSPWAIGSPEGGHTAIHPELGTLKDFKAFVQAAGKMDIEVSIDLAFQCSPDHPWVSEHPEWFKWRADGTVQYAENPPKKYQDVLPLHFESEDWQGLWQALLEVTLYWIEQGVTIFRVDNPHTKPFVFWEWMLGEVHKRHPEVLFLSEAFTRPRIMARLAKIGFHHSYTYFTWKNTKQDFEDYLNELVHGELREYMRPNFWPNTPDILAWHLQYAQAPMFYIRHFLAATLSSNYGIYAPAFDLMVSDPVTGKEEYYYSEKYELKDWDFEAMTPFRERIAHINRLRKDQPALQDTFNISFNETDSDLLLSYTKIDANGKDIVLCVVNLNPEHTVSGWVRLPYWRLLPLLGIGEGHPLVMQDLITNHEYTWSSEWNYVELNPHELPYHLFRVIPA